MGFPRRLLLALALLVSSTAQAQECVKCWSDGCDPELRSYRDPCKVEATPTPTATPRPRSSPRATHTASPTPTAARAPTICSPGKVEDEDTAGNCCWPGQAWSKSRSKCLGDPECPKGYSVQNEDCVAVVACPGTSHWDGKSCVAAVECPAGARWDGKECMAEWTPPPPTPTPTAPPRPATPEATPTPVSTEEPEPTRRGHKPRLLALQGRVAFTEASAGDMAVDPPRQRVYIAGGFGDGNLVRIDVADPHNMTVTALGKGSGVGVDTKTGRYATTDGNGSKLFIYQPDGQQYDQVALVGCGGLIDADPNLGRFFVSTQCTDRITIYNENTRKIVISQAVGGVGSQVVFDPGSGVLFENREMPTTKKYQPLPLVSAANRINVPTIEGKVVAVNPEAKEFYVDAGEAIEVRSSSTFGVLRTLPVTGNVAADTLLNRLYVSGRGIRVFDSSGSQLETVLLPQGFKVLNMKMAPGDKFLYVVGQSGDKTELFVYQAS